MSFETKKKVKSNRVQRFLKGDKILNYVRGASTKNVKLLTASIYMNQSCKKVEEEDDLVFKSQRIIIKSLKKREDREEEGKEKK